jgi:hypothetical protein
MVEEEIGKVGKSWKEGGVLAHPLEMFRGSNMLPKERKEIVSQQPLFPLNRRLIVL